MEPINPEKALSTGMHAERERSSDEQGRTNPRAGEMLSRVWLAAQAVWGHKWTSSNGDLPIDVSGRLTVAGAIWAEGLRGLTERCVLSTLDRLAKLGSEWPPTLPELRKASLGIPEFANVSAELMSTERMRHTPFARLVWSYVDGYAHRHASSRDAERMRREAYALACEHLLAGGGYPPEPAADLEDQAASAPQGIPYTREMRIARLQALPALQEARDLLRSL